MYNRYILPIVITILMFLAFLFTLAIFSPGKIGLIYIEGTITDSKSITSLLRKVRDNFTIKAVVIRVSSPGGGVAPSQEIMDGVAKLAEKKPVVVSMGSIATSGAYYISLPANVIMANPGTITGSIGVIMELPQVDGLMNKIGVRMRVVKSGKLKDVGSPFRDMTLEEKRYLDSLVRKIYEQFVKDVARYRKIPEDSVYAIADGRVFTGTEARVLGLIDTIGTLEDAVNLAQSLANLHGKPKVVVFRPKRSLMEELIFDRVEEFITPAIKFIWSPD